LRTSRLLLAAAATGALALGLAVPGSAASSQQPSVAVTSYAPAAHLLHTGVAKIPYELTEGPYYITAGTGDYLALQSGESLAQDASVYAEAYPTPWYVSFWPICSNPANEPGYQTWYDSTNHTGDGTGCPFADNGSTGPDSTFNGDFICEYSTGSSPGQWLLAVDDGHAVLESGSGSWGWEAVFVASSAAECNTFVPTGLVNIGATDASDGGTGDLPKAVHDNGVGNQLNTANWSSGASQQTWTSQFIS